jgi:hypothetical protein
MRCFHKNEVFAADILIDNYEIKILLTKIDANIHPKRYER